MEGGQIQDLRDATMADSERMSTDLDGQYFNSYVVGILRLQLARVVLMREQVPKGGRRVRTLLGVAMRTRRRRLPCAPVFR
jgi:hypothetical protein